MGEMGMSGEVNPLVNIPIGTSRRYGYSKENEQILEADRRGGVTSGKGKHQWGGSSSEKM